MPHKRRGIGSHEARTIMNQEQNWIPLRRPHFQLRGGDLYFLISRRPCLKLSEKEVAVWNAIDGDTTVSTLRERFPDADACLKKLHGSESIEFAESYDTDGGRRKILVIEPHMDDAVLSVGGLMWKIRGTCEFIVASVAGRSNFTSYQKIGRDYFDVDVVTDLRRRESELVMRLLGGGHMVLDGLDAPLRYHPENWTLEWFHKNRRAISAFQNHSATDEELETSTALIGKLLRQTDAREIWIPLGVGFSADHETTRNACLLALVRAALAGLHFDVRMYQDVPYAMEFPRHTGQMLTALESAGAKIERVIHDVSGEMPAKLRLISIFASQFKMSYMRPKVEKTARLVQMTGNRSCELLIKLENLPRALDSFELYSGKEAVLALRRRIAKWHAKNRYARRITILCPMGIGRWRENMEILLRCFPSSNFELHLTDDSYDETERFQSPRITIKPVHGLAKGWILRLLKVFIWPPRPLVLFTGTRFRHAIPLMRIIFSRSNPLPATTMNHLLLALNSLSQNAGHPANSDEDLSHVNQ